MISVSGQPLDKPAFSNGTEGEAWMSNWCYNGCVNEPTCPLLTTALFGQTPAEWIPDQPTSLGRQYRCTEFSPKSV